MKQNSSIFYSVLLIIGDFLALVVAFVTAYIIRVKHDPRPLLEQIPAETYLYGFITILPLWILVQAFIGLYNRDVYSNRFRELGRLIIGSTLGILVVIGYDFVLDTSIFPARLVAVYGVIFSFCFLVVFRTLARITRNILYSFGIGVNNVLIIGGNEAAKLISEEIANTRKTGYRIVGIVASKQSAFYKTYSSFQSGMNDLDDVDTIIQTTMYKDPDRNDEIMIYAQAHHISYNFTPGNNELFVGNLEVQLFRGTPVVTVHQTPLVGWGRIAKRLFDLVVSTILLIILSPLILLVIIFMKILNPRESVFFSQKRLTQFDRTFTVLKFRTQYKKFDGTTPEQAFAMLGQSELAKKYRADGDHINNDPRIIRGGKLLRATSIDELPQLFNVFLGDISLVGPRALVPQELKNYNQKHNILSIKSGITGLAQVSGRRNISFDERRKLDLYYVQNWSFWLDLSILLRTIRAVINGIGAK